MISQEDFRRLMESSSTTVEGSSSSLSSSLNIGNNFAASASGNQRSSMEAGMSTQQGTPSSTAYLGVNYEKAEVLSIPDKKYTMVLFPGRIKNVSNAINILGGMKSIQALHKPKESTDQQTHQENRFLECRFRPNNFMSCHPVYGDVTSTNNLLLRLRRKKVKKQVGERVVTRYDPAQSQLQVLGIITKTVNFKGLSDFQYIQPKYVDLNQSMDEDQTTRDSSSNNFSSSIMDDEDGDIEMQHEEKIASSVPSTQTPFTLEMIASLQHPHTGKGTKTQKSMLDLPPPIFSRFDMPMDYAFKQNPSTEIVPIVSNDGTSKKYKRLLKPSKQYMPHCVEINFDDEVPTVPPEEILTAKDKDLYKDVEKRVRFLFGCPSDDQEDPTELAHITDKSRNIRPIWSKSAISSKFESRKDKWKLRMVLPRVAYHYKNGPWRMLWVRYGYDPKKDVSASYYQLLDFRVPHELRPKIHSLTGKRKEDERETNKFRRLPRRRVVDTHIDLHDYLYSGQAKEKAQNDIESVHTSNTNNTSSATHHGEHEENTSYEFNSIPTQIQVFYQLCDIRIAPAQNIILADRDETIAITYGVVSGVKSSEELGLREPVWNNSEECDPKYGWYNHHALEQVRYVMKKKVEEWIENGEENDPEILTDTDEEVEQPESSRSILEKQDEQETRHKVQQDAMSETDDEPIKDDADVFIESQ
ncbi:hypothetical protein C9374_007005 [Naegleria lovaniensis]|uniref:Uncharacterized protein n=1 Tax=Naegleria lovaniensis TaxID=51637 RepID=A0AA88KSA7_NAELO|nr:uncharacterized protein C9374_007005 [Naegleria lovaniensis]KAG2393474.1 hypothetical protein C9374_007005 [Naegleria lovaniensis]